MATPILSDLPRLSDEEATHAAACDLERKAEPAPYTLGLSPMELLGHVRKELHAAMSEVSTADSLTNVAAFALRQQDCDVDSDVAEVLQSHAYPSLEKAQAALETAQQLIARLEQLQEVS